MSAATLSTWREKKEGRNERMKEGRKEGRKDGRTDRRMKGRKGMKYGSV
jgi:hypothetical protein